MHTKEPPFLVKSIFATALLSLATLASAMHDTSTWQVKLSALARAGSSGRCSRCETSITAKRSSRASRKRGLHSSITCSAPSVEALQCSIGITPRARLMRSAPVVSATTRNDPSDATSATRISRSRGSASKRSPARNAAAPGDTTRTCAANPPPAPCQARREASMRGCASTSSRRDTPIWLGASAPSRLLVFAPLMAGRSRRVATISEARRRSVSIALVLASAGFRMPCTPPSATANTGAHASSAASQRLLMLLPFAWDIQPEIVQEREASRPADTLCFRNPSGMVNHPQGWERANGARGW